GRLPGRDRGKDPASHHFVSDFAARPLTNGTLLWLFTGQGDDLAGWLGRDLRRASWTWHILSSLAHGKLRERHRLQADPARAPTAHRVNAGLQFSGNLCIVGSLGCAQDHPSSPRHLLRRTVSTYQGFQVV